MGILGKFVLDGKTALVTGCKRGIGKAMAIGLAEAGANIIGVSATLELKGSEVEKEVLSVGRSFYPYSCDFSDRKMLYKFIEEVKKDHQQVDILVNNAGIVLRSPATEHSDKIWDEVIEVNQNSQFILTREFGKEMVERGEGKVIFTASLLTYQGGITVPGYAASQGAPNETNRQADQLTKAFANEWASKGVNVNAIAPGYISTDITEALQNDPVRSKSILSRIPSGRWGVPEDLAGPTVFLASEASNYMHGSILMVDGGWMAR